MKTIWKFPLAPGGIIDAPKGIEILSVQTQREEVCIWGLVDPEAPIERLELNVFPTGGEVPDNPGRFIGTFQLNGGALVFHVFQPTEG